MYPVPLTHLRRMDSSTTDFWTGLFLIAGCLVCFYHYYIYSKNPVFNANNVDLDQTPQSALCARYTFRGLQTKMGFTIKSR